MRTIKTGPRAGIAPAIGLVTVSLAVGACLAADQPAGAAADGGGAAEGVVARVETIEITQAELESNMAAQLKELERQRHELLEKGMEAAIDQALLDLAAAAKGISKAELLERTYEGIEAASEGEISGFYEARKAQINQPLSAVSGQISAYLSRQKQQSAYNALLADLKKEYDVDRYLEPWRVEIAAGNSPAFGPDSAPVTIIEFSDFQCPYCQRLAPTIDRIKDAYGDQVRLVFRQFPLPIHADAQKAAEGSLCAEEQGKFWEFHDAMFADIQALGVDQLKEKAANLGMDEAAFAQCLDSGKFAQQVAEDLQDGRAAGVSGTPAMFVNGRFLSGAVPYEQLAAVIDDELERGGHTAE